MLFDLLVDVGRGYQGAQGDLREAGAVAVGALGGRVSAVHQKYEAVLRALGIGRLED